MQYVIYSIISSMTPPLLFFFYPSLSRYVFVGDSVKKDINEIIDSMSDSLKRKLKFIVQSTEGRGAHEDHDTSERKDSTM